MNNVSSKYSSIHDIYVAHRPLLLNIYIWSSLVQTLSQVTGQESLVHKIDFMWSFLRIFADQSHSC